MNQVELEKKVKFCKDAMFRLKLKRAEVAKEVNMSPSTLKHALGAKPTDSNSLISNLEIIEEYLLLKLPKHSSLRGQLNQLEKREEIIYIEDIFLYLLNEVDPEGIINEVELDNKDYSLKVPITGNYSNTTINYYSSGIEYIANIVKDKEDVLVYSIDKVGNAHIDSVKDLTRAFSLIRNWLDQQLDDEDNNDNNGDNDDKIDTLMSEFINRVYDELGGL